MTGRATYLDTAARRRHRLRNLLQSLLLLGGMVGLFTLCAWVLFGGAAALWALGGWLLALLMAPRASPRMVLRLYGASPLTRRSFPQGFAILERLTGRAGLRHMPSFWYVPSPIMNAFTMGRGDRVAIAVTDGMLQSLNAREFAGVLAHEISHIRNGDLWVMMLADSIGRLTSLMTMAGGLLLIVNLPLLILGRAQISWIFILLLLFAPSIASLLQMGLSRAREYDADLEAVALSGDPAGLASALNKLEHQGAGLWERLFMPGRRLPEPSLLRSPPPTEERIRRLLSLYPPEPVDRLGEEEPFATGARRVPVAHRPRWRMTGLWH